MKVKNLDHVLRSVDEVTNVEYRFLLIGSQAILAHIDPEYFRELIDCEELFISQEIDVAPLVEDREIQEKIADIISGSLGELSAFDQTYGYHADGVDLSTPILARGWETRLKPYESPGVPQGKFFALSYEDLLVSKLVAGREKDLEFVKGMCRAFPTHPGLGVVGELLESLAPTPAKKLALERWWRIYSPQAKNTARPKA